MIVNEERNLCSDSRIEKCTEMCSPVPEKYAHMVCVTLRAGRLDWLHFNYQLSLLSPEIDVIEIALCHKQFKTLILRDCVLLEELFNIWEENREKMIGKEMVLLFNNRLVATDLKGDLQLCSLEECEYIEKELFYFHRSELNMSSQAYKIKSELITDDKHNIFVFIEREEKGEEVAELGFLTDTDEVIVLFS
ncbi:hypothetical protein QR680_006717 [Steinernema hermaphroditum]|uniref:Uncharacterized protein n=1 Tax=Steinernema hermaphroditum TaxID=289476 RepID=A0AA39HW96_9BILA|nr:hypothetical protein QR680_006717 [Steinernema hermaphroditum]